MPSSIAENGYFLVQIKTIKTKMLSCVIISGLHCPVGFIFVNLIFFPMVISYGLCISIISQIWSAWKHRPDNSTAIVSNHRFCPVFGTTADGQPASYDKHPASLLKSACDRSNSDPFVLNCPTTF